MTRKRKKNLNVLHQKEVERLHELSAVNESDEFMDGKDINWLIGICFRLNSKLWRANKEISRLRGEMESHPSSKRTIAGSTPAEATDDV